ncbi:unnamed protein product [Ambrosiozyma monospora]|uniref:Unnamed protein product n=1 Tax=Ambrosiozyma monospora TaxID=43982 RepID=A0A9W6Z084_AMBMO|nr:unnamed protein product [Ambrosiozyma monospora]
MFVQDRSIHPSINNVHIAHESSIQSSTPALHIPNTPMHVEHVLASSLVDCSWIYSHPISMMDDLDDWIQLIIQITIMMIRVSHWSVDSSPCI